MITTRNNLQQYIDVSNITDEDLIKGFNDVGLEIGGWYRINNNGLKLAKVLKTNKVSNSEHLNWVTLELLDGSHAEVICGADNVYVDHLVIYAPIGASINSGLTLKSKVIMGHTSAGMICSLTELGVPSRTLSGTEEHDIFTLPIDNPWCQFNNDNVDLVAKMGLVDTVFDIELPLNRSDCLGTEQIARELGAFFNISFHSPYSKTKIQWKQVPKEEVSLLAKSTPKNFLSYYALKFLINPQQRFNLADWFRLRFSGFTLSLNKPFAMIQKLIMLETGCPTLIFDAQYLTSPSVVNNKITFMDSSNQPTTGWGFKLRDNKSYILGHNFDCFPTATSKYGVIISFCIDNAEMRRQQKQINSYDVLISRLMKPISPGFMYRGIDYFVNYNNVPFNDICTTDHYLTPNFRTNNIVVKYDYLNNLLGLQLSKTEIKKYLTRLNFKVAGDEALVVTPPIYRNDILGEADIAEELGRIYKFNNIPAEPYHHLLKYLMPLQKTDPFVKYIDAIENVLIQHGFYEIYTYNLISLQDNLKWNLFNYHHKFAVAEPLSRNHSVINYSLLPGLLNAVQYNNHRRMKNVQFFTSGKIYTDDKIENMDHHIAFAVQDYIEVNSLHFNQSGSFYYVKALVNKIANIFGVDHELFTFKLISDSKLLHPYQSAHILLGDQIVGVIIRLHPQQEKKLKMQKFYAAEVNLSRLINANRDQKAVSFKAWSPSNPITQDITIEKNQDFNPAEFKAMILNITNFCYDLKIIDIYPDMFAKKQKITFRLWFNRSDKQITERDIQQDILNIKLKTQ